MSQCTREAEFVVRHELGLHARPAGEFVTAATRFQAEIHVGREGEWVDGRSILSLLSLAAGNGDRLWIRAVGEDAAAAVEVLGALLERHGPPGSAGDPQGDSDLR